MKEKRDELDVKYQELLKILKEYGKCAVCFSGGMDSFILLLAAKEAVGKENVIAITMDTEFYPREDIDRTSSTIKQIGVEHVIISLKLMVDEKITKNDENRCYYCKKAMMTRAKLECEKRNIPVLFEGTNASDIFDHRPGMKACDEVGARSPLKEAGLTKPEIKELLSKKGFFEIVRPPDACLASRIKYDEPITLEKLKMTDAAEDYIKIFGYQVLRVRNVSGKAVIELDKNEIQNFKEKHLAMVEKKLLQLGYTGVEVAKGGYVHGSMNKPKSANA